MPWLEASDRPSFASLKRWNSRAKKDSMLYGFPARAPLCDSSACESVRSAWLGDFCW